MVATRLSRADAYIYAQPQTVVGFFGPLAVADLSYSPTVSRVSCVTQGCSRVYIHRNDRGKRVHLLIGSQIPG